MILTLVRTANTEDGVFGKLTVGGITLYTVEDDDKNNEPGESCIPADTYKLHRTIYHKGGYETFEVMNVPNRQRILIHKGNTEEDIKGCIAVGMRMGKLSVIDEDDPHHSRIVKTAVVESKKAFDLFMAEMSGFDQGDLVITWET